MADTEEIRTKIANLIENAGFSLNEASLKIGQNSAYLQQFTKYGKPRRLSETARQSLAQLLSINETELMDDEQLKKKALIISTPINSISIDVLSAKACCGNGTENFTEQVIGSYSMLPSELHNVTIENPANLKIIQTIGESMMPTIKPNEFVLVDISVKSPSSDGLYVLCVGEDLLVKRIQINPLDNSVKVISDNPAYEALSSPSYKDVRVVGRVIYHMKIDKIS